MSDHADYANDPSSVVVDGQVSVPSPPDLPVPSNPYPVARLTNVPGAAFPAAFVYDSYAGVDVVVDLVLPGESSVFLGELQTFSYSLHRENQPVRTIGHVMPVSWGRGSRTVAGSMIFTVFNAYAFYRLEHFRKALRNGLYPVVDMLPPFDINVTFVNEYGAFSKLRVLGMTIVDEGGTMSVDDLIQEATFSYMARGIQPLTAHRLQDEADATAAMKEIEAKGFNSG